MQVGPPALIKEFDLLKVTQEELEAPLKVSPLLCPCLTSDSVLMPCYFSIDFMQLCVHPVCACTACARATDQGGGGTMLKLQ